MKELNTLPAASSEAQAEQLTAEVMSYNDIISQYGAELNGNPAVYVGTYHKYNSGSLFGTWLDLTKFDDYDEFIDICRQLHADEEDPELMFQDYECYPKEYYSESCMDEDTFDKIIEYSSLSEDEREALEDYFALGNEYDLDRFHEAYCGEWDSEEAFAEHIIEECFDIDTMMGSLSSYFDYERYARDLFRYDYEMGDNGHVFRVM